MKFNKLNSKKQEGGCIGISKQKLKNEVKPAKLIQSTQINLQLLMQLHHLINYAVLKYPISLGIMDSGSSTIYRHPQLS